ncbi:TonB-dependent receptor [Caulobacter segnis]|uniref:TonB-dependent receptor n=1 Tax=Caulobacter segnis TaxID=88688 RepID=UPI00240FF537|nr:TonB-dependent receptor [Caulobacter segnis]MDG2522611.1 TonB-dependent receptor [Caulobacter segnis]
MTAWTDGRTMRRIMAGASLAALMTAPALAQSGQSDLDQVVVTAARTALPVTALPLTVDIIDSETLSQQVAIGGSIVDAVSTLSPSFSPTRQKLSGAGESLRGRSPLYAINGIPQSTPIRDGSRDGFTVDPFFIDRIELIYGSNALQGIGATGGVVNQVTAGPPREDGTTGRALLQASADGGFQGDGTGGKAAALVAHRNGAFDATVGASYEARGAFYDAKDRRVGVDTTQGEIQDSKSWSLFGRFGWQFDDSLRLDIVANRFELKGDGDYLALAGNRLTGVPTSSVRGAVQGKPAANRAEMLSASLTDSDLWGGDFSAQLFFNRTRDTFGGDRGATFQDIRIAPIGTLLDQSSNRSRKLGARASYERALPFYQGLTTTVGLDAMTDKTEQSLLLTGRVWVPPTEFTSVAPFIQGNLALLDGKLRVAGGVRSENVELAVDDYVTLASYGSRSVAGGDPTFSATLFNGGVVAEPARGVRLYASYAEGYTVPDVGRILRAVNTNGVDVDDYLDISPVVSNNREIGAELKRGAFSATATYFWSSSKFGQLLVLNPATGVFDVQRQKVAIEGLELNLEARTPVEGLTLMGGYARLRGQTDSNGDGKVDLDLDGANISPDRVNLAAAYINGPWSARLQTQFYIKRDFNGPDPRNNFEGYNIVDAYVRYETGLGGLSLSVSNLLDEQYVSYSSDTANPTDNLRYFAGRGRVFTVGWDRRF